MDRNDATSFWGQVVESAKESELGLLNQNTPHRASQASAGPLDRRPPARSGMGLSGRGGKTPAIELQKKFKTLGSAQSDQAPTIPCANRPNMIYSWAGISKKKLEHSKTRFRMNGMTKPVGLLSAGR